MLIDASNCPWSAALTEAYSINITSKNVTNPITYVSGLFQDSQLNLAALTKGAYTIYMAVKKLAFYLANKDIQLPGDHLP